MLNQTTWPSYAFHNINHYYTLSNVIRRYIDYCKEIRTHNHLMYEGRLTVQVDIHASISKGSKFKYVVVIDDLGIAEGKRVLHYLLSL